MAYNVFGNPITNETLKILPEYAGKEITRTDRAHVALNLKNAANKDANARQYVDDLKKEMNVPISTRCLVYNATGDTLEFITSHDYQGHLGNGPYPVHIANGQWGGFLHVQLPFGSSAAVVYRGKNEANEDQDWMLAWSNPFPKPTWDNKVYTQIRDAEPCGCGDMWAGMSCLISNSGTTAKADHKGCLSYMSTGNDNSAIVEAVLTLKNA